MYLKVIRSGIRVQVYEYEKDPPQAIKRKRSSRTRDYRKYQRSLRSIQRAKKSFVGLVAANLGGVESPVFLTLTMLESLGLNRSYEIYTLFVQRFRRYYGKHVRIIAVPEFQKRGAVHFHCLVWGLKDIDILHEGSLGTFSTRKGNTSKRFAEWLIAKGYGISDLKCNRRIQNLWGYGTVDCLPSDGSIKLAGYMAKYMSKAMQDRRLVGEKAYSATRNVLRTVSFSSAKTPVALAYIMKEVNGVDSRKISERDYPTMFLGRCNYKEYNLSGVYE